MWDPVWGVRKGRMLHTWDLSWRVPCCGHNEGFRLMDWLLVSVCRSGKWCSAQCVACSALLTGSVLVHAGDEEAPKKEKKKKKGAAEAESTPASTDEPAPKKKKKAAAANGAAAAAGTPASAAAQQSGEKKKKKKKQLEDGS